MTISSRWRRFLHDLKVPRSIYEFLPGRSQFLVFAGLSNILIVYLTFVVLFGMWTLSSNDQITIGMSPFCASFVFTSMSRCDYIMQEGLVCPHKHIPPTCVSWYDTPLPFDTIIALQVLLLIGIVSGVVSCAMNLYIWINILELKKFNNLVRISTLFNFANALVSVASFCIFLYFPYINDLYQGVGCVYMYNAEEQKVFCYEANLVNPPFTRGYAFTYDVVIFVLSSLVCIFQSLYIVQEHNQRVHNNKRNKAS